MNIIFILRGGRCLQVFGTGCIENMSLSNGICDPSHGAISGVIRLDMFSLIDDISK